MRTLIIIALWIPLLCFANETDVVTEQQLVIQETIDNLQRMKTLRESTSARLEEPVEEDSGPWLITTIYLNGVLYVGVVAVFLIAVFTAVSIIKSVVFNYYLFIEHGEYAFMKEDVEDYNRDYLERDVISKSRMLNIKEVKDYPWFSALMVSGQGIFVVTLFVLLWPIAIFLFGPNALVWLVTLRKRKKKVFEKKLKGEMSNGTV